MVVKLTISTLGDRGKLLSPGTEITVEEAVGTAMVKSGSAVEVKTEQPKRSRKKKETEE